MHNEEQQQRFTFDKELGVNRTRAEDSCGLLLTGTPLQTWKPPPQLSPTSHLPSAAHRIQLLQGNKNTQIESIIYNTAEHARR